MAINLYNTKTMLSLQEAVKPKSTFLRDRYFPTASEDIFTTEEVIVDFKDETDATLAPVVIPGKGAYPWHAADIRRISSLLRWWHPSAPSQLTSCSRDRQVSLCSRTLRRNSVRQSSLHRIWQT